MNCPHAENVPVYVRRIEDTERAFLGRFRADGLEALVKDFSFWGCFDGEDGQTEAAGQFFIDARGNTGFEIMVGES